MSKQIKEIFEKFLASTGVSTDTRKIQPENLFFALKGPNFNGNAYATQALEKGALQLKCNKVATGHNADDIAETVLMNMLRGDLNRLGNCVNAISG